MWPIKERENRHSWWPNLISYNKLYKCVVTVLLLTSTSPNTYHAINAKALKNFSPFEPFRLY